MVVVDRKYKGAAAQATLQTTMTATTPGAGGTISVDDDSGYPSTGKFSITIDRGLPGQEHVLINSRSGTTFTIGQRAYDDSAASAHTSGQAIVEHWFAARDAQAFVDHVDDVESDPHSTKLLNNARHDVEARHTFGAAYGTPVTPSSVGTVATAGSGNNPSREDHAHDLGVGSIDASNLFAAGVVDAAAIGADQVGTSEIAPLAVTAAEIANDTITATQVAANAIGSSELANDAVDTAAIQASAVTLAKQASDRPQVKATRTTTQSVPHNTFTEILFNGTEAFDVDGMHSTVTNPGRLTAVSAGQYIVGGFVVYAADATGARMLRISHSAAGELVRESTPSAVAAIGTYQTVQTVHRLAVGEYFILEAFQQSGSALNVNEGHFWAVWVGH